MRTFRDIIGLWGLAAFAADLGVSYHTARMMRYRNSIHSDYWPRMVECAERRGFDVTFAELAEISARRWPNRRSSRPLGERVAA